MKYAWKDGHDLVISCIAPPADKLAKVWTQEARVACGGCGDEILDYSGRSDVAGGSIYCSDECRRAARSRRRRAAYAAKKMGYPLLSGCYFSPGAEADREIIETAKASLVEHTCQQCGETFTAKRADAKYCSATCRQRARRSR
jgi:hypothetical protein